MKAARFMGVEQIEVGEIPTPTPKNDEVLAKISYAGYCGTDMDLLDGTMVHIRNGFTKYPLVPGHEWSGTVVAVGKDVRRFAVGDRITADVSLGCGCCDYCHHGRYNLCYDREVIGSYRNRQGAFAEYIAVPERHTYKIPKGVSLEEAALAEPAATAAYAVRRSNIQMGDRVLVIGDGPIGQLAAQLAWIEGAVQVIVAGSWDEKLSIAKKCGATATINYHKSDVTAEAIALTDGKGPDVIIESSGNQTALAQAVAATKARRNTFSDQLVSRYADPSAGQYDDYKGLHSGLLPCQPKFIPSCSGIYGGGQAKRKTAYHAYQAIGRVGRCGQVDPCEERDAHKNSPEALMIIRCPR